MVPLFTQLEPKGMKIIESNPLHYLPQGLELLSMGLIEREDCMAPLLSYLSIFTSVDFREVVHIDPETSTLHTLDSNNHTFDYLIWAAGLRPKLEDVRNLEDLLNEKFSFVCSNYSIETALKCRDRIDNLYGSKIYFYSNGE
jgi:NADH dehydrogenase FAD-containing subunit